MLKAHANFAELERRMPVCNLPQYTGKETATVDCPKNGLNARYGMEPIRMARLICSEPPQSSDTHREGVCSLVPAKLNRRRNRHRIPCGRRGIIPVEHDLFMIEDRVGACGSWHVLARGRIKVDLRCYIGSNRRY